jgi:hypothetical protein
MGDFIAILRENDQSPPLRSERTYPTALQEGIGRSAAYLRQGHPGGLQTFFVPEAPHHGLPGSAFWLLTVAYSVLIGWVFVNSRGSALVASLLHGAINLSQGYVLGGVDPARTYWLLAAAYGTAALVLTLVFGASLSRKHQV